MYPPGITLCSVWPGWMRVGVCEKETGGGGRTYLEGVLLELEEVGPVGAQEVEPARGVGVGVGDTLVAASATSRGQRDLKRLRIEQKL